MDFTSCQSKQQSILELFKGCCDSQSIYDKIIDLGRSMNKLDPAEKTESHIVKGCQSTTYLTCRKENDVAFFQGESDALISNGLLALLLLAYNQEPPEVILKCPPTFIDALGLASNLSPNRANGLFSMHLRMKQEALKLLMN